MTQERQLHFISTVSAGRDVSANTWTLPGSPITLQQRLADNIETITLAEEGKLDAVLYADINYGASPKFWEPLPPTNYEALTLFSYAAALTNRIGLVPSLSTTFDLPFQVARRVLSLDHLSGGRAGWNIVATFSEGLARAISPEGLPKHFERYRRADEFTQIVTQLWDGYEDDAVIGDVARRVFADAARIHPTRFAGEYFDVEGILGSERSVQGRPVIFQAGSSADGQEFAAKHAEVIFTSQRDPKESLAFSEGLRGRAEALGRPAPLVLPGLTFIIGATQEEADRLEREYLDAVVPEVWLSSYGTTFFHPDDAARLLDDLDAPLPPFVDSVEGYQTAFEAAKSLVGGRPVTVREFLYLVVRGEQFAYWVGTPEYIADEIEKWFTSGAADGFVFVLFHDVNTQLRRFNEHVLPILRRKGLFREDYTGSTLREHLGLERPANSFLEA